MRVRARQALRQPDPTNTTLPECTRNPTLPECTRNPTLPECTRNPTVPECTRNPTLPECRVCTLALQCTLTPTQSDSPLPRLRCQPVAITASVCPSPDLVASPQRRLPCDTGRLIRGFITQHPLLSLTPPPSNCPPQSQLVRN